MNWNPYKRIANLESTRQTQLAMLDELTTMVTTLAKITKDQGKWLAHLETRLQDLSNPVTITRADVDRQVKDRLKRAAYAKKYYAKKKAAAAGGAK